jgi:predicted LPLAT superfamily acyltransferase
MQPTWLRYRERGSVFAYKFIAQVALTLGRPVARLLLYPICVYYLAFSRTTPRASRKYLAHVLGRPPTLREVFEHHRVFAAALLDRAFLNAGRYDQFDVTCSDPALLQEILHGRKGWLMLGAHIGSFELTRAFAHKHGFIVNMLMYEVNAQKVASVMEALDKGQARRIIPIGRLDAMLRAKECLDRGEMIGMLGDRAVGTERVVRVPFFGENAEFPCGPFLAAAALRVPVIFFVALYRGGNRYEVHFERFAEGGKINRRDPAQLETWVRRYAERLEHYCRVSPYNWFNFFDFWAHHEPPASDGDQP